mmetsp:Transcript_42427/g.68735  ORF Transcript_42427/g.68735 Transcript_42427/m.68735 type:complete len:221 (+) Transcript_42427:591-1253(+)
MPTNFGCLCLNSLLAVKINSTLWLFRSHGGNTGWSVNTNKKNGLVTTLRAFLSISTALGKPKSHLMRDRCRISRKGKQPPFPQPPSASSPHLLLYSNGASASHLQARKSCREIHFLVTSGWNMVCMQSLPSWHKTRSATRRNAVSPVSFLNLAYSCWSSSEGSEWAKEFALRFAKGVRRGVGDAGWGAGCCGLRGDCSGAEWACAPAWGVGRKRGFVASI